MKVTPTPFNEDLIIRYLLGELPEEQRVEIEERAFQNEQYLQGILEVENDLIDEYVRGEIPLSKRNEFERHFLASAERRRKVDFARALATVASETETAKVFQPVRATPSPVRVNSFLAFVRGLNPAAAVSFATAALVLVAGASWLIRDSIRLRSQLSQLRAERQSQETRQRQLEEQLAAERTRNQDLNAQVAQQKKEEPARLPQQQVPELVTPSPPTIATLTLLPGVARGSGNLPTIEVRPSLRTVRFRVGIDPEDDYSRFRVELRNQRGERVWFQDGLSARATRLGRNIGFNLPARLLEAGRYELSVHGTAVGKSDDLGYYYFEVQKR